MKNLVWLALIYLGCMSTSTNAQDWKSGVTEFVESNCLHCHDSGTETRLNFESLGHELSDADTFRKWERIFDRIHDGEMPPASEPRPDAAQEKRTLELLRTDLLAANAAKQQQQGRVPFRRLTRLEHAYTLKDLLLIEEDLAKGLPEETNSGGFDTIGTSQGISPIHIRSYLDVADQALDAAIKLGRKPFQGPHEVDYFNSPYLNMFHKRELRLGGSVTKKLDDGIAMFIDTDYLLRTDTNGFQIRRPGVYQFTIQASAYQAKRPVILKMIHNSEAGGGAKMLGAFDLEPGQSRTLQVSAYMQPRDYLYPSVENLEGKNATYGKLFLVGGAKNYGGPGIKITSLQVKGPLAESWPPPSTQRLLDGIVVGPKDPTSLRGSRIALTKKPIDHVSDIVNRFATRAFRRPLTKNEMKSFVALAQPALKEKREILEAVRLPLRSILSSPQFLFHGGEPGALDNYALATRLSYFLWKSMPDDVLFELAAKGKLTDRDVLRQQVDRMLADPKSERFVSDFLGQWLSLKDINATTPDENLYPEYDDVLNKSILEETEMFFTELIKEDLPVSNLIDSDFAFLNRRLAIHYRIPGIEGQNMRKVQLPEDSPRGGILTQASILKTTANGTVTSPVTRGNFVLTSILGTPPSPPPPNVGSIEPDTRGTTTIRETLDAHRNIEACAVCHRRIDPPGFALESFDPIGKHRKYYRATKTKFALFDQNRTYSRGPKVDASGTSSDGQSFSGIKEYKEILLKQKNQVARNFVTQLIAYSTGGELEFADRGDLETILERTGTRDYPVKSIIHEVVQSRMFRNK